MAKRSPTDPTSTAETCPYCAGTGREPAARVGTYGRCLDCDGAGKRCSECLEPIHKCLCGG
jgi:hypothetical protein